MEVHYAKRELAGLELWQLPVRPYTSATLSATVAASKIGGLKRVSCGVNMFKKMAAHD